MPQYDPYDPEEVRRRQMLAMDDTPEDSYVMSQDEEEVPDSQTESSVPTVGVSNTQPANRGPAPMTDVQKHYQQVLGQMPMQADYKPSRGRRILASIAGGFAGASGGPHAGAEIAQGILSKPYSSAMSNWEALMSREAEGMKLEGTVQAQDIARERARNYAINAQARQTSAEATRKFREYQAAHMPWAPQSEEEATRMEKLKHPGPNPPRPTPFQEFNEDPLGYQKFRDTFVHPLNPNASTREERDARARMQEAGRNARSAAAINARPEQGPAPPKQQADAENLAVQRLIRRDPKYAAFWKPPEDQVVGNRTVRNPGRIVSADELPKASSGGIFGGGAVSDAQASLARTKYAEFLSELEKEKQRVLGSKAPGASRYTVSKEED